MRCIEQGKGRPGPQGTRESRELSGSITPTLGGRGVMVMPRPLPNDGFLVPEPGFLRRSATFLHKDWRRRSSIDGQRPRGPEDSFWSY